MGDPKDRTDDGRRAAPRAKGWIPVCIRLGDSVSTGTIHDMSVSGARIEGCPLMPAEGSELTLSPSLEDRESRLWIRATVVRLVGEGGFAVRFVEMDPVTEELLERLPAP